MKRFLKPITLQHLLATVIQRTAERSVSLFSYTFRQDTREAKIDKYQLLTMRTEANIAWLNIHMHNLQLMQKVQFMLEAFRLNRAKVLNCKVISLDAFLHRKFNAVGVNENVKTLHTGRNWPDFQQGCNFKNSVLFNGSKQATLEIICFDGDALYYGVY